MAKITQTEFKKWGEQIFNKISQITAPGAFKFNTETERQKIMKIGVISSYWTEQGVILAPLTGFLAFFQAGLKTDIPLNEFDGLTLNQWGEKILNRIKDHCIANGYYKPSSPPDLALLKERRKKVSKFLKDNNELKKILNYANKEEKEIILNFYGLIKAIRDELPDSGNDDEDIPREADFIHEDLVGRLEKLVSKKEEAEKANSPASPNSNSPNSPLPKPPVEYKNDLEAEIKRLQGQISELEDKVNKTDNITQKETYRKMLDNNRKDLDDKKNEKDKLSNPEQKSTSLNNNSNKLNWAIGLGIAAAVISILGVILLLAGQKKKKKH